MSRAVVDMWSREHVTDSHYAHTWATVGVQGDNPRSQPVSWPKRREDFRWVVSELLWVPYLVTLPSTEAPTGGTLGITWRVVVPGVEPVWGAAMPGTSVAVGLAAPRGWTGQIEVRLDVDQDGAPLEQHWSEYRYALRVRLVGELDARSPAGRERAALERGCSALDLGAT